MDATQRHHDNEAKKPSLKMAGCSVLHLNVIENIVGFGNHGYEVEIPQEYIDNMGLLKADKYKDFVEKVFKH